MKNVIGIVAISVAVVVVVLLSITRKEPAKNEDALKPIQVTVEELRPQSLTDIIIGHGQVTPRWQTTLASEVNGRVLSVSENLLSGARFNRGDVLAVIDATTYEAALASAQATLETARRTLKEEQQRAKIAAENWLSSGFQDQPPALVLRKPQLREAQARIASAQSAVKKAEYDLTQTRILAPYDGAVLERSINPGDILQVGGQVARVYDRTVYEVAVPLNENEIKRLGNISPSLPVTVYTQQGKNRWQGKVARIEQSIDQKNRWQSVIIEVRDTDDLLPGTFVTSELSGKTHHNILALAEHIPEQDGTIWFVDTQLQLQKFAADILFRQHGKILVRLPTDIQVPVRVTAGREIYLPGIKVSPVLKKVNGQPSNPLPE